MLRQLNELVRELFLFLNNLGSSQFLLSQGNGVEDTIQKGEKPGTIRYYLKAK